MSGECRYITSIVQKAHFVGASCLQGSHAFEEQIAFIGNPACYSRNNREMIRPTSAKEPRVACCCFDHIPLPRQAWDYFYEPQPAQSTDLQLSLRSVKVDFMQATIASHRRDVARRQARTLSHSRRPGRNSFEKNGKLMSETGHTLPSPTAPSCPQPLESQHGWRLPGPSRNRSGHRVPPSG